MSTSSTSKRRSSSSEPVLRVIDTPRTKPPMALVKHGKYVVVGGLGVWWTGLRDAVYGVLAREGGWIRRILLLALGLHSLTILIFLYLVLFLPWFRGYIPNYPKWQQSARLRTLVPVLTLTILLGWTSYVVSLSQAGKSSPFSAVKDAARAVGNADLEALKGHRGLGIVSSIAGTTGLYTLTFGLLGLIPPPSLKPVQGKEA